MAIGSAGVWAVRYLAVEVTVSEWAGWTAGGKRPSSFSVSLGKHVATDS
jgi:hypothetical protein